MSDSINFIVRTSGVTVEEVVEDYRQHFPQHGNDIDLLQQSMLLLQAGHYRESIKLAVQVQPPSSVIEEPLDSVDKRTAQAAFLAAHERARPLFEQAAQDIEGDVASSQTMASYEMMSEMLKNDPNW